MKRLIVLFLGILMSGLLVKGVTAQTSIPLLVSPVRQEIELKQGESTSVNVRFFNQSDSPVSGILAASDFVVDNRDGLPKLIDNPDQAPPKFMASEWVTLPYDRISIAANNKVEIQARITAPQDALPGGRYIALYFEPATQIPKESGPSKIGGLGVQPRIASLVYIKVPGNITEKAMVTRFFAPSLVEYGPVPVETEILNRGDYHIRPMGAVTMSNMFGGLVAQSSLKELNIFPDASRTYENKLGSKWMLGRYKLTLTAAYGDRGQVVDQMMYVWVFPWKLAAIVTLALVILLLLGKSMYKKVLVKEAVMEEELAKEREEIERLKDQLRKRKE